jgi:UDP-N-acetylglucosamine/UDP-N-acetylgalactosamine diphosphorylase
METTAMTVDEATTLLEQNGQGHVLRFWGQLSSEQREGLLGQVAELDFGRVAAMRSMLNAGAAEESGATIEPATVVDPSAEELAEATRIGERALKEGSVGVILVAGGQGSRLGFDGPKGSYPIGPVSGATLFEIHARKILALARKYDSRIPFYIMTSRANDAPTKAFFEEHDFFGLASDDVLFFTQGMWPALLPDGKLVLDGPGHLFVSPDGHGGILAALRERGMVDDMQRRGLETLFYFQVDNPLVEIAHPAFLGLHRKHGADISVKVCAKREPMEGLGVVARRNGRYAVVEYSDPLLTDALKHQTLPDGTLRFRYGSVAIHVFSLDFLRQEANAELPLHVAHKKVPVCDENGQAVPATEPNAYKFEKFIFDVLPDAERVLNMVFAREEEFSPVKNAEGADSPATTQRDMTRKFARWLESCGVSVPRGEDGDPVHKLEIDPCFALDARDLQGKLGTDCTIAGDTLLK